MFESKSSHLILSSWLSPTTEKRFEPTKKITAAEMVRLLYNIGIHLMGGGMRLAALFSPKIRLRVQGCRQIFRRMEEAVNQAQHTNPESSRTVWFHAASLGEFEQGRPVIEAYRAKNPKDRILVTFFSPSGYEVRKNYAGADYIFYLPTDTPRNVRHFLSIFQPEIAVFIKYEFWVNYLMGLRKQGRQIYLISAVFRQDQSFFKWYGRLFRKALDCFTHLFVQSAESKALLETINVHNVTVAGDTRFDRVATITEQVKPLPEIERFAANAEVFVAGSTWPPDEELIAALIATNPDLKFIIAPHEIDPDRIERFIQTCGAPALRYTQLDEDSDLASARVLFIDTIGILSSVYRFGRWGYIGGGFGAGIHNTLEAATFSLPLAFGPHYQKFQEAKDLIANGGATCVLNAEELQKWLSELRQNPESYTRSSRSCGEYVQSHRGATDKIIEKICG